MPQLSADAALTVSPVEGNMFWRLPLVVWRPQISCLYKKYAHLETVSESVTLCTVNRSHYRSEEPRGFQVVKVPRLRDNGPE